MNKIICSGRVLERVCIVDSLCLTHQIRSLPFPHCSLCAQGGWPLCLHQLGSLALWLPVGLDQGEAPAGDPRVERK